MQILTNNGPEVIETVVSQDRPHRVKSSRNGQVFVFMLVSSFHSTHRVYLCRPATASLSSKLRYTCDTSTSDSATVIALRIFGASVCSHTRRCIVEKFGSLLVRLPIWRSLLNYHVPCTSTPPIISFNLAKVTSNILATQIRKQNWAFQRHYRDCAGSACSPVSGSARNDIRVGAPYQNHATLRAKGYTTSSCFQQLLTPSSHPSLIQPLEKSVNAAVKLALCSCHNRRFSVVPPNHCAQRTH